MMQPNITVRCAHLTYQQFTGRDAAAGPDLIPSLADGSVDLISAAMVFHHVTNISKVLLELRRLISPWYVTFCFHHITY